MGQVELLKVYQIEGITHFSSKSAGAKKYTEKYQTIYYLFDLNKLTKYMQLFKYY